MKAMTQTIHDPKIRADLLRAEYGSIATAARTLCMSPAALVDAIMDARDKTVNKAIERAAKHHKIPDLAS